MRYNIFYMAMKTIDVTKLKLERFTEYKEKGRQRKKIASEETIIEMRKMKIRGCSLREIADFAGYKHIAYVSNLLRKRFPEDRYSNYYQKNK